MAGLLSTGCAQNEIGKYNWLPTVIKDPKRIRNQIVKSENYWIQKEVEPEEEFPGPTPADLKAPDQDYILGAGDIIDVRIYELLAPNTPFVTRQQVSQTGQIKIDYLGTVKSAGLTTRGLEEKLADMLEPDFLVNPQVNVYIEEKRNLSVSLLNGMMRPGSYPLEKQDLTLLEVVARAGGVIQLVEDYGYVIREYAPEEADLLALEAGLAPEEGEPAEGAEVEPAGPEAEVIPQAPAEGEPEASGPSDEEITAMLEKMAAGEMPEVEAIEEAEVVEPETPEEAALEETPAEALIEDEEELSSWIWSDGQWIEVKREAEEEAPAEVAEEPLLARAGEELLNPAERKRLSLERKLRRLGVVQGSGQLKRIIRFDVEALQAGDPTQNIVLRDGDIVTIPSPPVGDFYMTGQVARPGVYSLTGRKITLLQGVAAAGGLTAIAVPWRTEVVRRISETEEEIIYVDLAKVAKGESPDFYLKPEDLIRVGTDQGAIYNAVIRNAFRMTYGLGFVYDMNFADFYPWTDAVYPLFPGFH